MSHSLQPSPKIKSEMRLFNRKNILSKSIDFSDVAREPDIEPFITVIDKKR